MFKPYCSPQFTQSVLQTSPNYLTTHLTLSTYPLKYSKNIPFKKLQHSSSVQLTELSPAWISYSCNTTPVRISSSLTLFHPYNRPLKNCMVEKFHLINEIERSSKISFLRIPGHINIIESIFVDHVAKTTPNSTSNLILITFSKRKKNVYNHINNLW